MERGKGRGCGEREREREREGKREGILAKAAVIATGRTRQSVLKRVTAASATLKRSPTTSGTLTVQSFPPYSAGHTHSPARHSPHPSVPHTGPHGDGAGGGSSFGAAIS